MDTKKTRQTTSRGNTARRSADAKKTVRKAAQSTGTKTQRPASGRPSVSSARPVKVAAAPSRTRSGTPAQPAPEVVYTPAKPFNRSRLLLHLITVVAVVLALSFSISIFFKVEVITVSGTEKYDPWTIKEASGIEIGDNLLSFGEAKAAGKIKTALPYVETVRIGIKLPDTVNIEIKELDVVYAIRDAVEQWWLITSDGRVVDIADRATAGDYTEIKGVKIVTPTAGQQAVAYEETTDTTEETTAATYAPVVRASDRLTAALNILQYMEECGIIGEAASVDVSDLGNLELEYGQRFTVKLGDTTQLLYKIKCMNTAINGDDEENSLKDYDSGVLDVSFTIKENQVIYQSAEE